jgi:hypothetical protein
MCRLSALLAISLASVPWPTPAAAADLAKIDRTIKKEPAYKGKPRYCLLAFGPEAKAWVWLVLDGDVLYVDRDGDGDLTGPGERVVLHKTYPSGTPSLYTEQRQFLAGDLTAGGRKYTSLDVTHCVPNPAFVPTAADDKQSKELLDKHPGVAVVIVAVKIDGRVRQLAAPAFGKSPKEAPVIHFGGPLTMGFHPKWFYGWPVFARGKVNSTLTVVVGTPGVGEGSFALLSFDDVPKAAHPIAEIVFPGRTSAAPPVRLRVPLTRRC